MAAETDFSFNSNGSNVETDLYFNAYDINKCQCPPPIVESTTPVDDANVGTDFVVIPDDVNAPTTTLTSQSAIRILSDSGLGCHSVLRQQKSS
jgi:hypothetical protein